MGRIIKSASFAAVAVACAALIGGCGKQAKSTHDVIVISVPESGLLRDRGVDMRDAAQLALKANDDTSKSTLAVRTYDSARAPGAIATGVAAAASTPGAVAVIGGTSIAEVEKTAPIARKAGLLQIALAPAPSSGPTARDRIGNVIWQIPAAAAEGDALAQYVAGAEQKRAAFFTDRSLFARALQPGYTAGLAGAGITLSGVVGLNTLPRSHPAEARPANIVGAGNQNGFVQADDPTNTLTGSPHTLITPALTPDELPPAGERFYEAFKKEYGHTPDRFAVFAYEAVGLVIDAIERVEHDGRVATRANVLDEAFQIKDRSGPVGHYDVLPSGRTTLYEFQAQGGDAPTGPASVIEAWR